MSTVPPPAPPVIPVTTGGATPSVTVAQPPPAIAALPAGTAIEATVTAFRPGAVAELLTPQGPLQAVANIPLKPDQAIRLLVQPRPPAVATLTLQIVEVAGRPLQPGGAAATGPAAAGAAGTPGTPVPAATPATFSFTVGQSITALLLQPSAPGQTTSSGIFPGTNAATPLNSQGPSPTATPGLASQATPAGAPSNTTGTAAPTGSQAPQAPGTSAGAAGPTSPTPTQPANPDGALLAGTRFNLSIQAVNPSPSSPVSIAAAPLPALGQTFTAVVTGTTPVGQPIAQTPAGAVALENAPPLPKGAEVTLRLEADPVPPEQTRIAGPDDRTRLTLSRTWPALDEAMTAIADRAPALAHQINNVIMPQADAKLGATLVFLLSALKGGELKSWFGETALREVGRANADVLRRLRSDVRNLAGGDRSDGDGAPVRPTSTDWRVLPIPFQGQGMEQIRLLVRQEADAQDDPGKDKETRFVVDLTMSSIGRLQLDGLIDVGQRRFDMLVRTASTLPDRFRRDILQIFANSNEVLGLTGGLAFRSAPDALIDTTETMPAKSDDGIMV